MSADKPTDALVLLTFFTDSLVAAFNSSFPAPASMLALSVAVTFVPSRLMPLPALIVRLAADTLPAVRVVLDSNSSVRLPPPDTPPPVALASTPNSMLKPLVVVTSVFFTAWMSTLPSVLSRLADSVAAMLVPSKVMLPLDLRVTFLALMLPAVPVEVSDVVLDSL